MYTMIRIPKIETWLRETALGRIASGVPLEAGAEARMCKT